MIQLLDYSQFVSAENHGYFGNSPRPGRTCPYCKTNVEKRYSELGWHSFYGTHKDEEFLWESYACPSCGWWWSGTFPNKSYSVGRTDVATLHLMQNHPIEVGLAVAEINAHSERLYGMRSDKFEMFIADIFRCFYDSDVIHCGKSHDGGIDLVILDSETGPIPVQVKRRSTPNKTEPVSLVREFRGALLLSGHTRGKIVTTADHFSQEAVAAATPKEVHSVRQEIDLVDCRRLLNILHVLCHGDSHASQARQRHSFTGLSPEADLEKRILKQLENFARKYGWEGGRG